MIKNLFRAIKEVLTSFSPKCSAFEAMMKIDFKINEERNNLMQLCFSSLAAWPVFILAGVIQLNLFPSSWSLQQIFSVQMYRSAPSTGVNLTTPWGS